MRLRDLVRSIKIDSIKGDLDVQITGLATNSKKVSAGYLFACLVGSRFDGHDFLKEAIERGASALLVEKDVGSIKITTIKVKNTREAIGLIAARFYNHPSTKLKMIGVTGTNGKTTTTYLIAAILQEAGLRIGRISTTNYLIGDEEIQTPSFTTPPAIELQEILSRMVEKGVTHTVMEVSSHALASSRVIGCHFDIGVFTNISQDHLDFHHTFEDYLKAKSRLFESLEPGSRAIINGDDPYAKEIISKTKVDYLTYGLSPEADLRAEGIELGLGKTRFRVQGEDIELNLTGRHNVYNGLASIGVGLSLGMEMDLIRKGLKKVSLIPGRFELIEMGQDFQVVVDYAHTPDALESILMALKGLTPGRIITLFGCGGDRDRSKRPIMGEISSRLSDYLIITSDNPRSEDPLDIIREIKAGIKKESSCPYEIIPDRREAIRRAIDFAKRGDIVLVAGKGHETFQIVKDKILPFDDREVIRAHLRERLYPKEAKDLDDEGVEGG